MFRRASLSLDWAERSVEQSKAAEPSTGRADYSRLFVERGAQVLVVVGPVAGPGRIAMPEHGASSGRRRKDRVPPWTLPTSASEGFAPRSPEGHPSVRTNLLFPAQPQDADVPSQTPKTTKGPRIRRPLHVWHLSALRLYVTSHEVGRIEGCRLYRHGGRACERALPRLRSAPVRVPVLMATE